MTARDRLGFALAAFLITAAIAGGFWYVRDHRGAHVESRMQLSGVIMAKRIEWPPGKQMYPVRFVLLVQEADASRRTIAVDRATYAKAAVGKRITRDRNGTAIVQ